MPPFIYRQFHWQEMAALSFCLPCTDHSCLMPPFTYYHFHWWETMVLAFHLPAFFTQCHSSVLWFVLLWREFCSAFSKLKLFEKGQRSSSPRWGCARLSLCWTPHLHAATGNQSKLCIDFLQHQQLDGMWLKWNYFLQNKRHNIWTQWVEVE